MAWGSDDQNPSLAPSQTSGVNYAAQLNSAAYYNPLSGGSSSTGIAPGAASGGQPSYAQRLSAAGPAQPKQTTSQALAKSADRPQPAEASRAAREIQPWGGGGTRFEIAGKAASRGIDRVNGALVDIMQKAAAGSPYNVQLFSGIRPGDRRQHGRGNAVDIALVDPYSGEALANYQSADTFPQYEAFARRAYEIAQRDYPDLAGNFRWGGYFGGRKGKYGATDLMHFDVNSGIGMAGGSFDEGLTDRQARLVERMGAGRTQWAGLRPGNAVPGPTPTAEREPLVAMNPPMPRSRPAPAGFDTGRFDAATAYAPPPQHAEAPFDAVMADVPTPRQRPERSQQAPRAWQASSATPSSGGYTVQRGDTLAAIAQRELGDPNRWREIAQANGIRDPRRLMPGQQLVIPAAATRTVDIPQPRVRPRIASGPVGPTTARGVLDMGPRSNPRRDPNGFRIDVDRPAISNADGSISTERTATFQVGRGFFNVPTIVNGREVSPDEAYAAFEAGQNPAVQGPFRSVEEAEAAAQQRSAAIPRARATADGARVPNPRMRPSPAMAQWDDVDAMTEVDAEGNYLAQPAPQAPPPRGVRESSMPLRTDEQGNVIVGPADVGREASEYRSRALAGGTAAGPGLDGLVEGFGQELRQSGRFRYPSGWTAAEIGKEVSDKREMFLRDGIPPGPQLDRIVSDYERMLKQMIAPEARGQPAVAGLDGRPAAGGTATRTAGGGDPRANIARRQGIDEPASPARSRYGEVPFTQDAFSWEGAEEDPLWRTGAPLNQFRALPEQFYDPALGGDRLFPAPPEVQRNYRPMGFPQEASTQGPPAYTAGNGVRIWIG